MTRAVSSAGYASLESFLNDHEGCSYVQVAEKLGGMVTAIDVRRYHLLNALEAGKVRNAARDGLVREIHGGACRGWGKGVNWNQRRIAIGGAWIGELNTVVGQPSVIERARAVWRELEKLSPPLGWLPRTSRDKYIHRAFVNGWPTDD